MGIEKGIITHIYEAAAYWLRGKLLARGIDREGYGFSNRPLELDDSLQPQVTLDNGEIVNKVRDPKNSKSSSQS